MTSPFFWIFNSAPIDNSAVLVLIWFTDAGIFDTSLEEALQIKHWIPATWVPQSKIHKRTFYQTYVPPCNKLFSMEILYYLVWLEFAPRRLDEPPHQTASKVICYMWGNLGCVHEGNLGCTPKVRQRPPLPQWSFILYQRKIQSEKQFRVSPVCTWDHGF